MLLYFLNYGDFQKPDNEKSQGIETTFTSNFNILKA
jgi:hypothetical protein